MIPESLKQSLRSLRPASDLEAERLLLEVSKEIVPEMHTVQLKRASEKPVAFGPWTPVSLTDRTESASVIRFTDEDEAFIRKCGADPAGVASFIEKDRAEKEHRKRKLDGPIALTDAESDRLRRLGHDPEVLSRMNEVHSPADYQRIKAEVKGGAA